MFRRSFVQRVCLAASFFLLIAACGAAQAKTVHLKLEKQRDSQGRVQEVVSVRQVPRDGYAIDMHVPPAPVEMHLPYQDPLLFTPIYLRFGGTYVLIDKFGIR